MTLSKDQIFSRVANVLIEALNVEEDQVTPEARLQADLGAESIDFLDIVFRLEREFGVKIQRGELFPESIFSGDPELVQDGVVTADGLKKLREGMPFANQEALAKFEQDPQLEKVGDLFTVELVARFIEYKLGLVPAGQVPASR